MLSDTVVTGDLVPEAAKFVLDVFPLTFYDFDGEANNDGMEIVKFKGHEPGSLNQAFSGLQGQWVTQGTEGDLTTFTSAKGGTGKDNPTSPSTLTTQQKYKSVSAKWLNTCLLYTSPSPRD